MAAATYRDASSSPNASNDLTQYSYNNYKDPPGWKIPFKPSISNPADQ